LASAWHPAQTNTPAASLNELCIRDRWQTTQVTIAPDTAASSRLTLDLAIRVKV
jgi:hypothetical protein